MVVGFTPGPTNTKAASMIHVMEKSVTFTGACANEIIPSINRSFVYKAKEGRYVRIYYIFTRYNFINFVFSLKTTIEY
jgi:hypothetical protein